jgi:hypothetical protein
MSGVSGSHMMSTLVAQFGRTVHLLRWSCSPEPHVISMNTLNLACVGDIHMSSRSNPHCIPIASKTMLLPFT